MKKDNAMNLDDLARAAYTAVEDFYSTYKLKTWDELGADTYYGLERQREIRSIALAVASAVLEAVEDAAERHDCGNNPPECCNCLAHVLNDIRRMVEGMKGSGT